MEKNIQAISSFVVAKVDTGTIPNYPVFRITPTYLTECRLLYTKLIFPLGSVIRICCLAPTACPYCNVPTTCLLLHGAQLVSRAKASCNALINMYPHPPPGTTRGNSGAFTSVLTMLWSPGVRVGYLIREQTVSPISSLRMYSRRTPDPIASVLLQAPERRARQVV